MMEGNRVKRQRGPGTPGGEATGMSATASEVISDEGMMDFTMDELREFLAADHLDVPADPDFRERLRRKLWDLVQSRTKRSTGS